MQVPGNPHKSHCKYCDCDLKAKYEDLKHHISSKKHAERLSGRKVTPLTNIFKCIKQNASSKVEGSIAMFLSCHCAIANCVHLIDMLKNNIGDSKVVNNVKMYRSKCKNVIKNIFCSHFEENLKCDIGSNKYSLLLDESNDVSVTKLLGVSMICCCENIGRVISTYLGLVQLEQCNAESIVSALKTFLSYKKLDLRKLAAIGTDNASVMVGINNCVYAQLKNDVPTIVLLKCACRSLQLAVSHAAAEC